MAARDAALGAPCRDCRPRRFTCHRLDRLRLTVRPLRAPWEPSLNPHMRASEQPGDAVRITRLGPSQEDPFTRSRVCSLAPAFSAPAAHPRANAAPATGLRGSSTTDTPAPVAEHPATAKPAHSTAVHGLCPRARHPPCPPCRRAQQRMRVCRHGGVRIVLQGVEFIARQVQHVANRQALDLCGSNYPHGDSPRRTHARRFTWNRNQNGGSSLRECSTGNSDLARSLVTKPFPGGCNDGRTLTHDVGRYLSRVVRPPGTNPGQRRPMVAGCPGCPGCPG